MVHCLVRPLLTGVQRCGQCSASADVPETSPRARCSGDRTAEAKLPLPACQRWRSTCEVGGEEGAEGGALGKADHELRPVPPAGVQLSWGRATHVRVSGHTWSNSSGRRRASWYRWSRRWTAPGQVPNIPIWSHVPALSRRGPSPPRLRLSTHSRWPNRGEPPHQTVSPPPPLPPPAVGR